MSANLLCFLQLQLSLLVKNNGIVEQSGYCTIVDPVLMTLCRAPQGPEYSEKISLGNSIPRRKSVWALCVLHPTKRPSQFHQSLKCLAGVTATYIRAAEDATELLCSSAMLRKPLGGISCATASVFILPRVVLFMIFSPTYSEIDIVFPGPPRTLDLHLQVIICQRNDSDWSS